MPDLKPGRGHAWLLAACMLVGAIALGFAVQIKNGTLDPAAINLLTIAFVAAILGVSIPGLSYLDSLSDTPLHFLLGLGLAFQVGQMLITPPGAYLKISEPAAFLPYFAGLITVLVIGATWLWPIPWLKRLRLPVLVLVFVVMGVWMIKASPSPSVDVYVFQEDGAKLLASGGNPYTMTYPDAYGYSRYYGAEWAGDGRLNFGFPYPPLSLLWMTPGQTLLGDPRYMHLLAMALSALLIGYTRPGSLATGAAALFLFTPRAFYVLEQSWVEPLSILCLAAVVFLAERGSRWWPLAFGLLLVSKQVMLLALPLAWLLLPRPLPSWKRLIQPALMMSAGALISLPLALWNLPAFWRDVVTLHVAQQFRPDSLSYLALLAQNGSAPLPSAFGFIAAVIAIVFVLMRAPRTPSGFAAGLALVFITFFAFSKQAFCNYYYFVIGAMCCAVAAAHISPSSHTERIATHARH
jgi:hypothetical protein